MALLLVVSASTSVTHWGLSVRLPTVGDRVHHCWKTIGTLEGFDVDGHWSEAIEMHCVSSPGRLDWMDVVKSPGPKDTISHDVPPCHWLQSLSEDCVERARPISPMVSHGGLRKQSVKIMMGVPILGSCVKHYVMTTFCCVFFLLVGKWRKMELMSNLFFGEGAILNCQFL